MILNSSVRCHNLIVSIKPELLKAYEAASLQGDAAESQAAGIRASAVQLMGERDKIRARADELQRIADNTAKTSDQLSQRVSQLNLEVVRANAGTMSDAEVQQLVSKIDAFQVEITEYDRTAAKLTADVDSLNAQSLELDKTIKALQERERVLSESLNIFPNFMVEMRKDLMAFVAMAHRTRDIQFVGSTFSVKGSAGARTCGWLGDAETRITDVEVWDTAYAKRMTWALPVIYSANLVSTVFTSNVAALAVMARVAAVNEVPWGTLYPHAIAAVTAVMDVIEKTPVPLLVPKTGMIVEQGQAKIVVSPASFELTKGVFASPGSVPMKWPESIMPLKVANQQLSVLVDERMVSLWKQIEPTGIAEDVIKARADVWRTSPPALRILTRAPDLAARAALPMETIPAKLYRQWLVQFAGGDWARVDNNEMLSASQSVLDGLPALAAHFELSKPATEFIRMYLDDELPTLKTRTINHIESPLAWTASELVAIDVSVDTALGGLNVQDVDAARKVVDRLMAVDALVRSAQPGAYTESAFLRFHGLSISTHKQEFLF